VRRGAPPPRSTGAP